MVDAPKLGTVVDLEVRFGTQTRLKCPYCTKYLSAGNGTTDCQCGAGFQHETTGWRVTEVPDE